MGLWDDIKLGAAADVDALSTLVTLGYWHPTNFAAKEWAAQTGATEEQYQDFVRREDAGNTPGQIIENLNPGAALEATAAAAKSLVNWSSWIIGGVAVIVIGLYLFPVLAPSLGKAVAK